MEYPLEKYKNFIKAVEASPLFDKHESARITYESTRINCVYLHSKYSPNAVAKIVKSGKIFSIRYTYEGFNRVYVISGNWRTKISDNSRLMYKLRRISSRNSLTHKILEEVIKCQRRYLETGDPIDLVPLSQVQLPFDNSWTSRLVNRLSVITPSGEEKPLKWFFQTQKGINKRYIKQLLDKENEDIESGRLNKPLTDNQIRAKLESNYGVRVSRHSVGHCRKDMGIPPAKRRLSGYKYPPLSAGFSMLYPFVLEDVLKNAPSGSGIYELRIKAKEIEYPNGKTQVVYIGSTKNIKKRLREHLGKNSKNGHIRDFLKKFGCSFRYILFKKNWQEEEKRLYRLFMDTYGSAPKCNRVKP